MGTLDSCGEDGYLGAFILNGRGLRVESKVPILSIPDTLIKDQGTVWGGKSLEGSNKFKYQLF